MICSCLKCATGDGLGEEVRKRRRKICPMDFDYLTILLQENYKVENDRNCLYCVNLDNLVDTLCLLLFTVSLSETGSPFLEPSLAP